MRVLHPDIELEYFSLKSPFDWPCIFENDAAVELEIGFGKCGFLLERASQYPDLNFIGIEKSRKYYRKGVKKIQRADLQNIKLIWGEAYHIFKRYIAESSLQNIYVNFPDPWPKKRHAKRRLLNAEFLELAAWTLRPMGCVEVATDAEAYIQEVNVSIQHLVAYARLYYVTSNGHGPVRTICTEYERDFLEAGKTIHYAKYQKTQHTPG